MVTKEIFLKATEDKLNTLIDRRRQLKKDLDECDMQIFGLSKIVKDPEAYQNYLKRWEELGSK